ncbi:MAG: cytochrome c oxidase subunit 3, partial [Pseudomonadota bacterium]
MAGQKNHDYHIIDPSPWPIMGAIGGFTMLTGMVIFMKGGTPAIAVLGFLVVLYTMYVWWRDVIRESQAGDHTPVVSIGLRMGMILFIMSEVMFFS